MPSQAYSVSIQVQLALSQVQLGLSQVYPVPSQVYSGRNRSVRLVVVQATKNSRTAPEGQAGEHIRIHDVQVTAR